MSTLLTAANLGFKLPLSSCMQNKDEKHRFIDPRAGALTKLKLQTSTIEIALGSKESSYQNLVQTFHLDFRVTSNWSSVS